MKSIEIELKEVIENFNETQDAVFRKAVRRLEFGQPGKTHRFRPQTMETKLVVAEQVREGKLTAKDVGLTDLRESAPIRRNNGFSTVAEPTREEKMREADAKFFESLGEKKLAEHTRRGGVPEKLETARQVADYRFLRAIGFKEADAVRGVKEDITRTNRRPGSRRESLQD